MDNTGAANIATVHFRGWVDAAKLLQPDLLVHLSVEELRSQFRRFVAKLEELAPTQKKLDNLKVFSLFLNPNLHLYTDIQSVLAIMANASVAMGLESVVEEEDLNPKRQDDQDDFDEPGGGGGEDVDAAAVGREAVAVEEGGAGGARTTIRVATKLAAVSCSELHGDMQ